MDSKIIYPLTFLLFTNLFSLAFANEEKKTIAKADQTSNEYIENALASQPNEAPNAYREVSEELKQLEADRMKVQSNEREIVQKNPASDAIPEIQSVSKKSPEERAALYKRLANQTDLTIEEIKDLFEGNMDKNAEKVMKDRSNSN